MKCPKCGSENTQRLKLVHEHGTQTIKVNSTVVGGAHDDSFLFGAGRTEAKGTSQSTMAKKAAPPTKQSTGIFIGVVVLGLLCFVGGFGWNIAGGLLIVGGSLGISSALAFNREQWPQLLKTWQESWVCNKCGNFYHQALD